MLGDHNVLNWILSLLVHSGNLTVEEAEHLSEKLVTTTHPQRFRDAHVIVEKLLADFKRNK